MSELVEQLFVAINCELLVCELLVHLLEKLLQGLVSLLEGVLVRLVGTFLHSSINHLCLWLSQAKTLERDMSEVQV